MEENFINPSPPEELGEEENKLLRGDAIGDTVYTQRWVLQCLMKVVENFDKYVKSSLDEESTYKESKSTEEEEEDTDKNHDCTESSSEVATKQGNLKAAENENCVLELDEEVENSACQLWDMTVERDVVLYLIDISHNDIEIVVGILANLCCQEEGCQIVLQDSNLLASSFNLLHLTRDVPTLVEATRMMHLLAWHARNSLSQGEKFIEGSKNVPEKLPEDTFTPLIMTFCKQSTFDGILFILKNSLNDQLLRNIVKILEYAFFIKSSSETTIVNFYSKTEFLQVLIDTFEEFLKKQEDKNIDAVIALNSCLLSIYAFIDTPGGEILRKLQEDSAKLESLLMKYLEISTEGIVASSLTEEKCEHLCFCIGLCQLIAPYLKQLDILQRLSRIMAIVKGVDYQYLCTTYEEEETVDAEEKKLLENNHASCGWFSPDGTSGRRSSNSVSEDTASASSLHGLEESLEDFFACMISAHPKQDLILQQLNQCHTHEVLFILHAVRKRNKEIVSQLQERLLEQGTYNRLVALLAEMYQ